QRQFCLVERRAPVGGSVLEKGSELGSFGQEPLNSVRSVVDGEAGVGLAAEGVEDFVFRGALVGQDAAVVDVGESGDVPGVGGVAGATLPGVASEPFEGGGAEEVDLGPGTALDAIDGAGPGMGAVGAAIRPAPFDEFPGERGGPPVSTDGLEPGRCHGGDGDDAAVVEALTVGPRGGVDGEAVGGGVAGRGV